MADWFEPKSHYLAQGSVDGSGKMTGAEVTDNNGILVTRNASFDSKEAFAKWAKQKAGV